MKTYALRVLLLSIFLIPLIFLSTASAQQDPADVACQGISATGADCSGGESGLTDVIQNVVRILLFVIGAASVVMLVVGALRFTLSAGDAQAAASAKNTILYAIIGLIVASSAFLIADFVFEQVSG